MSAPLRIGDMLYGYCGGAFGRDSCDDKRVEAIGSDWVVVRTSYGTVEVAGPGSHDDFNPDDLCEYRTPPLVDLL